LQSQATTPPATPYVIPLSLHGITLSFPTRKPTPEEYESLPHLALTSDAPEYNPHDSTYVSQEAAALTKITLGTGDRIGAPPPSRRLRSVTKTVSHAISLGTGTYSALLSLLATTPTLDDGSFAKELNCTISVIK
jgi:hypothetical protein